MADNVIRAALTSRATCTVPAVYQYNTGMRLLPEGVELPASYRVDYANSEGGASVSQLGDETGAPIPSQFFVPGATIHAYIVLVDAESTVTQYHVVIPVSPRAVPTDETPSPEEQSTIDELITALGEAEARYMASATVAETKSYLNIL